MPDDEEGVIFEPEWPVFGVSWHDAVAYCEWRSGVEAWTCRLPGDLEWEKMARGVDGRVFPWGNGFDATFCKMDTSRAGKPQPEPVGTFSGDESIYGVRDVAGCIREWCSDWKIEPKTRVVRGGSWSNPQMSCRCAYRASCEPYLVYQFIGFRVAHDLPRR
ncbi:MAG: formylglycine-generating enzyme family protein [Planctomycetota bacterium]